MKPRLLDLFCGAGGAAMGYHRAGFEVVGVDMKPQPRYPFEFIQADAMTFPLDGFDAIHASPPCQAFSVATLFHRGRRDEHPNLIPATRHRLESSGLPYAIENVIGAPLLNPMMLCGTMFPGLKVYRHRLFECNPPIYFPPALVDGVHGGGIMTRKARHQPADHPHHWRIDEPDGPTSAGVCLACGAARTFSNIDPFDAPGKGAWRDISLTGSRPARPR